MRIRNRALVDWRSQLTKGKVTTWNESRVTGKEIAGTRTTYTGGWGLTTTRPGQQETADEVHPEWRFGIPPGDCGGPFRSVKQWVRIIDPSIHSFTTRYRPLSGPVVAAEYHGNALAWTPAAVPFPPSIESSDATLGQWGAIAIARCKPTNVPADLSVFLAELKREGLPRIAGSSTWRESTKSAKRAEDDAIAAGRSAGDEYLNVEFGWKPVISDVKAIAESIARADEILSQYERGSGSLTRRRFEFPEESSSEITTISTSMSGAIAPERGEVWDILLAPATVYRRRTTYRKVWFEGAFTYHLPDGWDSRSELARIGAKARTLLGLDITPSTVWNLTPWSWAVDWFSNVGDVISNLSDYATDGLVMRYGYVMEHTLCRDHYFANGAGQLNLPHGRRLSQLESCVETKKRVQASPFGFGLSWSGLSPRQKSIAAALGLTRLR